MAGGGEGDRSFVLCSFLPDALNVFQSERTRECNEGEGGLISICTEEHKRRVILAFLFHENGCVFLPVFHFYELLIFVFLKIG